MNYVEFKRKTLAESIRKHQSVIDDFRARISTVLNEEPVINDEEVDMAQQAKISQEIITEVNPLGDQLAFANEEMRLLLDMTAHQDDVHEKVEPGSIVVTDKDIFFVSASIERFEVDGKSVFGLSTEAPLYKVMEGKKEGESFSYKDNVYKIKEIF
jgi:hypothetical protein